MYLDLITGENQQYYEHLIPREYQSRLGMTGILCAGAALFDKELTAKEKEAFKLTKKLGRSRIIVGVPQTAEEYGITKRFFASRGFRESGISYREWSFVHGRISGRRTGNKADSDSAFLTLNQLPKDVQEEVFALAASENLNGRSQCHLDKKY